LLLVKPSFEIWTPLSGEVLSLVERAGRTAYKSEQKITPESNLKFVEGIIKSGHESVIEHFNITVKIICDRGVTHEIVRHRLVSYSQESTRYCNYKGGVTFVIPPWVKIEPGEYPTGRVPSSEREDILWFLLMMKAEGTYIELLRNGWSPQQARSVLPNSLKTEIVMTANLREWRHIFKLRTSKAAHPQMREIMVPLLRRFKELVPVVYDDIRVNDG